MSPSPLLLVEALLDSDTSHRRTASLAAGTFLRIGTFLGQSRLQVGGIDSGADIGPGVDIGRHAGLGLDIGRPADADIGHRGETDHRADIDYCLDIRGPRIPKLLRAYYSIRQRSDHRRDTRLVSLRVHYDQT